MTEDLLASMPADNPDEGIPRDKWGRYLLPDPTKPGSKPKAWTRATTFNKTVADTYVLDQWGNRMVAKGLAMRPDLYAMAAATPLSDRDKLNEIAEEAKKAAGSKTRASLGTALHAFTEQHDRGERITVPDQWRPDVDAYIALCKSHGLAFRPDLIERTTVVPQFGVAGTFDRIVKLTRDLTVNLPGVGEVFLRAGDFVIDDTKTGRDLTYGWNEISIQLALYSRGKGLWNPSTKSYDPMPALRQDVGLVVHLPVGEAKATLHAVNLEAGWEAAALCERVRKWRKTRGVAAPVSVTATVLDLLVTRSPSWADRIASASSPAELKVVCEQAVASGEWSDDLLRLSWDQLSKIRTA